MNTDTEKSGLTKTSEEKGRIKMRYVNEMVIFATLFTTVIAISLSIVTLAEPDWRHILVFVLGTPVLNGVEGLWEYCEDLTGLCVKLDVDIIGGWMIAVRVFGIFSAILFCLAFFAILTRILGNLLCVPIPKRTRTQAHSLLSFLGSILLLASALLYSEKVNYDQDNYIEKVNKYVEEVTNILHKRGFDLDSTNSKRVLNSLNGLKEHLDKLPIPNPLADPNASTGSITESAIPELPKVPVTMPTELDNGGSLSGAIPTLPEVPDTTPPELDNGGFLGGLIPNLPGVPVTLPLEIDNGTIAGGVIPRLPFTLPPLVNASAILGDVIDKLPGPQDLAVLPSKVLDIVSKIADSVVYKAEVRYCYHTAIFGGIIGLISCGLSIYQTCRDTQEARDVQQL